MDHHPSPLLVLSKPYVKLPPTSSAEEQGEDQPWHSTQPPIPALGERGQPVSLAKVKLILSPVQETGKEGGSQLLSELTKLWSCCCPPVPRHPGRTGGTSVWEGGMSSCPEVPAWNEEQRGLIPSDIPTSTCPGHSCPGSCPSLC